MASRRAFSQQGNLIKLSGDTFSIKEELKQLGARFDGSQKCWFVGSNDHIIKKLEFLGFLPLPSTVGATASVAIDQANQHTELTSESDPVWSVSQFTLFAERIIKQYLGFDFWIVGEISSLKTSSGHLFFDLTEPDSDEQRALSGGRAVSVSCCLWAGKVKMLTAKLSEIPLADGLKIKLRVHCDFRKEGSRFSLIVNDIDSQFTLGDLALKRQQIVRELKRRGLYDRQRHQARWPSLPLRIALITSAASRAQTDFLNELAISGLAFRVTLFDCFMQGEKVRESVCEALKLIAEAPSQYFDCVVITRGGGSRLDLRWFDDLEICKAIAYSEIPVMTAIGHFEDVSIADEVSALAEKTPTGAARCLVGLVSKGFDILISGLEKAARLAQHRIQREKIWIDRCELRIEQSAHLRVSRAKDALETAQRSLRLVQNTSARPLRMGYSLLLRSPDSVANQNTRLTADDFLTSAPPTEATVELWSRQQNAQVLIKISINDIQTFPLPADGLQSIVGPSATPTQTGQNSDAR